MMMKKGNLLRNKHNGELATIISDSFTKLIRTSADWEAMRYGGDYATAYTCYRIRHNTNGLERTLTHRQLRSNYEVIENTQENTQ